MIGITLFCNYFCSPRLYELSNCTASFFLCWCDGFAWQGLQKRVMWWKGEVEGGVRKFGDWFAFCVIAYLSARHAWMDRARCSIVVFVCAIVYDVMMAFSSGLAKLHQGILLFTIPAWRVNIVLYRTLKSPLFYVLHRPFSEWQFERPKFFLHNLRCRLLIDAAKAVCNFIS